MRVVHIMASSEVGGGAKYLELLLPELRALGVESTVITSPSGPLVDSLRAVGIAVHTPVNMMAQRWSGRAFWRLRQCVGQCKPDLVHFHGTRAAFQGAFISKRYPTIYTSHGSASLPQQSNLRRSLMMLVERQNALRVRRYTGVSKRDVESILGKWKPEAYIPNPVDPRFLAATPVALDLSKRPKKWRIGTVGRLVPQKGLETLLDAASQLGSRIDIDLQIVGGGPLMGELKKQALELGLNITFHGSVSDPLPLLRSFDIFVAPSRWEGQPLSVLEAIAAAIPTVVSDCPGLKELAEELNLPFTCHTDSASALADEILRLIDTPWEWLNRELNRLVVLMTDRTPVKTAERWLEIYQKELGL